MTAQLVSESDDRWYTVAGTAKVCVKILRTLCNGNSLSETFKANPIFKKSLIHILYSHFQDLELKLKTFNLITLYCKAILITSYFHQAN